jgi:hypothetical protein
LVPSAYFASLPASSHSSGKSFELVALDDVDAVPTGSAGFL